MRHIWRGIIYRCTNPKSPAWRWYGWRGIRVCERWRGSYAAFAADLLATIGPRPSARHSLDRIDVNGHYEPGNVRWATPMEQAANKRRYPRRRPTEPPKRSWEVDEAARDLALEEWRARYLDALRLRELATDWRS